MIKGFKAKRDDSETSLELIAFGITLLAQVVKSVKYYGVTAGARKFRASVFFYVFPDDVPSRDRFFTYEKTNYTPTTETSIQIGKRRILGLELISVNTKSPATTVSTVSPATTVTTVKA